MSERDLIQELKATIKDLSDEKEDLLKTIKQKESRIKTVMIKLEHATQDVSSVGHKIADKDKEITKNCKIVVYTNVFYNIIHSKFSA